MTSVEDIKAAIEKCVKGRYRVWTIGLTSDPGEARQRNGDPLTWFEWQISENFGLDIVNFFHEKGMDLAVEMVPGENNPLISYSINDRYCLSVKMIIIAMVIL